MRRMITDKELSFFDAYAQSGAIGKYSNISVSTKSISEWNGVKIAYGYMKGSTFPYDLTIDFNGAKDLALNEGFANANADGKNIIIKNADIKDFFLGFSAAKISTVRFENVNFTQSINNLFLNCNIKKVLGNADVSKLKDTGAAFLNASSLNKLELKHWRVDFNISSSTEFDTAALVEIISNLDDTGSPHTLTIGTTNLAKLSEAQIKVATDKGWNLA